MIQIYTISHEDFSKEYGDLMDKLTSSERNKIFWNTVLEQENETPLASGELSRVERFFLICIQTLGSTVVDGAFANINDAISIIRVICKSLCQGDSYAVSMANALRQFKHGKIEILSGDQYSWHSIPYLEK